jgi:hypothetical protein
MYSRREDIIVKMSTGTILTVRDLQKSTKKKNSKLITGITLFNMAEKCHRNYKKAFAIAQQFLHKGTELPSGTTLEDFIDHILATMFLKAETL